MARGWLLCVSLAFATFPGCGGGASSGINPWPPSTISGGVSPPTGNVLLGKSMQLSATVTGTTNNAVTWIVYSVVGGNSSGSRPTIAAEESPRPRRNL